MVIDVKLRLYDFPSKVGSGLQSIACKGVDIAGKILLDQISQLLNVSSERLTLIFRGKLIKSHTRLKALNFKSGQLLHVLYKPSSEENNLLPDVDANRLKMTMVGLHLIFWGRQPDHRGLKKSIVKLLKDSKRLQKIIDSVPGLKDQPIATDILRHPDIFSHVVEPTNFDKILQSNKQLAAAILLIWDSTPSLKSVKELLNSAASSSRPTSSRVSPREEYYDDEDMDTEQSFPVSYRVASSPAAITSNQLAHALSVANNQSSNRTRSSSTGSAIQSLQTGSTSRGGSSVGSRSSSSAITADVFSMAMQQALAVSNSSGGIPQLQPSRSVQSDAIPTISREVMERGMSQLRSMGIGDEEASRQALMAASGNVEAAVNILFASGLNDL